MSAYTLRYEVRIDTTDAALARYAAALLCTPCDIAPLRVIFGDVGPGITGVLVMYFQDRAAVSRFREICRPREMRLFRTTGGE